MAAPTAERVTGERVNSSEGGFNPTFQRHVAAYRLCAGLLPADVRVMDLGCGVGHSYEELAPRETVGVDIDPAALRGQDDRETVVADMRALPFESESFDAILAVQSLEHVPDPDRALAEAHRVLRPGGRAVFVTPNRLTFGRPDEVIDPYHFVEFSEPELREACRGAFERVQIKGIGGSERYLELVAGERRALDRTLAMDPLKLRRALPRTLRCRIYDRALNRMRRRPDPAAAEITASDFGLQSGGLDNSLDLIAVCDR
jgi:SAM-dependent methyltransferase